MNMAKRVKSFLLEAGVYGFGNVFSRFFAMLLIPLYTNYLGKIDYSNIILLQSTFSLLTYFLALNAGVFYYYYESNKTKYRSIVFSSWFYYQIVSAICILLFLILLAPYVIQFFILTNDNQDDLYWGIILVGFQLFPYAFGACNMNYFRIDRKPVMVVIIITLESFFTLSFVFISLHFLNGHLKEIILSQIIARILVVIIFIKFSHFYTAFKNVSIRMIKQIFLVSWPFIVASIFSWFITYIDKFIGIQVIPEKTNIAYLSLAMQLTIPLTILADMIRMAVGPFVMSIRKEKDAGETYQVVFDLIVYLSSIMSILLILAGPILIYILADNTYIKVMYVLPLMAYAQVIYIAGHQVAVHFSLEKKNIYIMYAIILSSFINIISNWIGMQKYGFVFAGISQIAAYSFMFVFLYVLSKKKVQSQLSMTKSTINFIILTFFILLYTVSISMNLTKSMYMQIFAGVISMILLTIAFFIMHKLTLRGVIQYFINKNQ